MSEEKKFLDIEGLRYLWAKISMNDYPNNEMLAAVIKAIDETKVDRTELVQSDWKQTDATALDFIKNKLNAEDAMELALEVGFIDSLDVNTDAAILISSDGTIYTDEFNNIYTL